MSLSVASKLAAAGLTASLAVGGLTTVVLAIADDHPAPRRGGVLQAVEGGAELGGVTTSDPAEDASASAKVKTRRGPVRTNGKASASAEDQRARASLSVPGHAGAAVHGGNSGGLPVVPPGSAVPGPGTPGPGGSHWPDFPETDRPAAPSLSQLPGSASIEGGYTVVVPPTSGTSKKLCLSGEVNRCRTVTVPATSGATIVLRWSGNVGAARPDVDVDHCPGGLSVTVKGLTPGATISVAVDDHELSRTVGSRELSQTASLCDA